MRLFVVLNVKKNYLYPNFSVYNQEKQNIKLQFTFSDQ